jgi:hypothetical protein
VAIRRRRLPCWSSARPTRASRHRRRMSVCGAGCGSRRTRSSRAQATSRCSRMRPPAPIISSSSSVIRWAGTGEIAAAQLPSDPRPDPVSRPCAARGYPLARPPSPQTKTLWRLSPQRVGYATSPRPRALVVRGGLAPRNITVPRQRSSGGVITIFTVAPIVPMAFSSGTPPDRQ